MKGKSISFRPDAELRQRIDALAMATEHDITWVLEKAIESCLPGLEQRYARELAEFASNARKSLYPAHRDQVMTAAERPPKRKTKRSR